MKDTHTSVPEIIKHLNPVTEQFGPLLHNSGHTLLPSAQTIRSYAGKLLIMVEKAICDITHGLTHL